MLNRGTFFAGLLCGGRLMSGYYPATFGTLDISAGRAVAGAILVGVGASLGNSSSIRATITVAINEPPPPCNLPSPRQWLHFGPWNLGTISPLQA